MSWTEEEVNTLIAICAKHPSITAAKPEIISKMVNENSTWERVSRKARRLKEEGKLKFSDGTVVIEKKVEAKLSPALLDKLALLELIYPGSTKELSNVPVKEKRDEIKQEIQNTANITFGYSTQLKPAQVVGFLLSKLVLMPSNTQEFDEAMFHVLANNSKYYEKYARNIIRKLSAQLPEQKAILDALDGN
jgi:hypothetical protein